MSQDVNQNARRFVERVGKAQFTITAHTGRQFIGVVVSADAWTTEGRISHSFLTQRWEDVGLYGAEIAMWQSCLPVQ